MGTFSIWHWIIVLLVTAIYVGIPVVATLREDSGRTTSRGEFIAWIVGVFLLLPFGGVLVGTLISTFLPPIIGSAVPALLWLACIVLFYPLQQHVVRRLREAGFGKDMAYLSVIPVVNVAFFLFLAVMPPKSPSQTPI